MPAGIYHFIDFNNIMNIREKTAVKFPVIFQRQLSERLFILQAISNDFADNFMRFTKSNAFLHQIFGDVGSRAKPLFRRDTHFPGLEFGIGQHLRKNIQTVFCCIHRVEQGLFIFL
ncbi:MAG: hypothetical protein BWY90_01742 [Deltaproteobacteria bacterium ADurb.BinA014]|nr:MAG: hypothetical protein BWY90_01742 [Deltaproteobacteria bacterium ADurb.BinA014]